MVWQINVKLDQSGSKAGWTEWVPFSHHPTFKRKSQKPAESLSAKRRNKL